MTKFNFIEKEFIPFAEIRGETLLLPFNYAIEFINRCEQKNIKILGIDGFFLTNNITRPSMEDSIDLSSAKNDKSYKIAKLFIKKRQNKNTHFEIVIDL